MSMITPREVLDMKKDKKSEFLLGLWVGTAVVGTVALFMLILFWLSF